MASTSRDTPQGEDKQSWAEAVIECVSDSAERERLIRMYDYDELVKACLALGTLALSAKHESARNKQLEEQLSASRSETSTSVQARRRPATPAPWVEAVDIHERELNRAYLKHVDGAYQRLVPALQAMCEYSALQWQHAPADEPRHAQRARALLIEIGELP